MTKTEFILYKTKTILNKQKRPDPWFWVRYSAYPYIGCQHGCEFCYCREKKYAPYEDFTHFSTRIKIKENAPQLLRKALQKNKIDAIAVGDYQPAERKYEISRQMLAVCAELNFPVFVLERSPLVTRDMDILQSINEKAYASVVFSVIYTADSPNAHAIQKIEHLAPPPEARFKAMREFAKKGILTGTCFMPILPGLCDTDENIDRVIRQTRDNGGNFVLASTLTLADQQKQYFLNYLEEELPHLVPAYKNFFPNKSYGPVGGYWNEIGLKVREACAKHSIADRMPRPVILGEKRVINKKIVEQLTGKTYQMELENDKTFRVWAYRKAAWAIEDMQQDINLVYKKMGRKGLEGVPAIGKKLSKEIESMIQDLAGSTSTGFSFKPIQ